MSTLRLDVWSDIACPWCYVGKRRLEAAIARVAERGEVEVVWHAFELDPSAPPIRDTSLSYAQRLAMKYGASLSRAEEMIGQMTKTAADDGLDLRFDRIRPGNTFDAHRLLQLAVDRGVQGAVKERFLRAYLTEGEPIGDREVLTRLAVEAGLDGDEVRAVLASERYTKEVRTDEAMAHSLGISGVPFFVIDGRLGVSGAQPVNVLADALTQGFVEATTARAERAPTEVSDEPELPEGSVCGPDGC